MPFKSKERAREHRLERLQIHEVHAARLNSQTKYRESNREILLQKHREYNKDAKLLGLDFKRYLKYNYNLTPEQYQGFWNRQNGLCAIRGCGWKLDSDKRRPHIDHNHACCAGNKSCGKCVRGLLCPRHNFALGNVNDSQEELLALIDFLRKDTDENPRMV